VATLYSEVEAISETHARLMLLLIRWIRAVEHVTRAHNIKVCCSVLQCVAVCSSVLQCGAVWCSVVQGAAVCCSVL